ncbi:MAG: hypothetical protein E6R03_16290 [Hyphomicrobiaceae bacterium]|nr:MAG: hypothetical protein E6R03_16290 [Hyphomicrobiaceae bacterium]
MSDTIDKVMRILLGSALKEEVDPIRIKLAELEKSIQACTKSIATVENSVSHAMADLSVLKMQAADIAKAANMIEWEDPKPNKP